MGNKNSSSKSSDEPILNETKKCNIEDYELIENFAKGSFAVLWKGYNKKSDEKTEVAIKIIEKSSVPEEVKNYVLEDHEILNKLDHPNILKIHECWEDDINYYCVTPLHKGGDLFKIVNELNHLNENLSFIIFKQLLDAVEYIHGENIIHRDIKLENILLNDFKSLEVILADFGFATHQSTEGPLLDDFPGTLTYVSPEMADGLPYEGRKSDIWAIGIVYYCMLTGEYPFYSKNPIVLFNLILHDEVKFPDKVDLNLECKNLLKLILIKDPNERPSIQQIKEHPYYQTMNMKKEN